MNDWRDIDTGLYDTSDSYFASQNAPLCCVERCWNTWFANQHAVFGMRSAYSKHNTKRKAIRFRISKFCIEKLCTASKLVTQIQNMCVLNFHIEDQLNNRMPKTFTFSACPHPTYTTKPVAVVGRFYRFCPLSRWKRALGSKFGYSCTHSLTSSIPPIVSLCLTRN